MIDMRFPTALQAVLMVAAAEEDGVRATSGALARGLGANPSFVRRLLLPLGRAGIVTTTLGQKSGIGLGRPAAAIDLGDVYRAVTDDSPLWTSRPGVPGICFVSVAITDYSEHIAAEARVAVLDTLGRRTIVDALAEIRARAS